MANTVPTNKVDIKTNKKALTSLILELAKDVKLGIHDIEQLLINHSVDKSVLSKSKILYAYEQLKHELNLTQQEEERFYDRTKMKKIRTLSGVAPVTVLTKPFPCPGKCIFCPSDVRMPKSYLSDEPGAQRAHRNKFDPYLQTYNRLVALKNMGHKTDKVEIIILGGTWSSYPEFYQIWFVKRCFDGLNDFDPSTDVDLLSVTIDQPYEEKNLTEIDGSHISKTYNQVVSKALAPKLKEAKKETATWEELFQAHIQNETARTRCIGLVIETRPDEIDEEEVLKIRKLGATKVQIGIQSLNNRVLRLNKRGHDVKQTRNALNMLRSAGFKIHAHVMPNLYGSNPLLDKLDFLKMYSDKSIRVDELKIYPCSLIKTAELMRYYESGKWKPYSQMQLSSVLEFIFKHTKRYTRLTRVIRDIPSTDIVVGNKITNFRQLVEKKLKKDHERLFDIRSREIKDDKVNFSDLKLKITKYKTKFSTELFIEYVTHDDKIAAFLRLSFPIRKAWIPELKDCAIIREVHVYGPSVDIGDISNKNPQHIGLGTLLLSEAEKISKKNDWERLAVISSIGTRKYYEKFGYILGTLYQTKNLS